MAEYVERLDVLKELALLDTGEEEYTDNISRIRATIAIGNIPAADVVPVVHGHWKDNKNGTVSCSRCSTWFQKERVPYLRFCGYCGAKMDGGDEHEAD